jgi:hypothetical protein
LGFCQFFSLDPLPPALGIELKGVAGFPLAALL